MTGRRDSLQLVTSSLAAGAASVWERREQRHLAPLAHDTADAGQGDLAAARDPGRPSGDETAWRSSSLSVLEGTCGMELVKSAYSVVARLAARRAAGGRLREGAAANKGRFTLEDVDRLMASAWRRYDETIDVSRKLARTKALVRGADHCGFRILPRNEG